MNVRHRKRGGDLSVCVETSSAQHCLCDEEISASVHSDSVDKPNSEKYHPRQTRGVNDFVINDYHRFRNLCEPSHWNEWGECAGVCGQVGVAVRVRTIESCVEEVDEMACNRECNNDFQRLQDLYILENIQEGAGIHEGDAAYRNVNENPWEEVPTELYSKNSVFSGSDNSDDASVEALLMTLLEGDPEAVESIDEQTIKMLSSEMEQLDLGLAIEAYFQGLESNQPYIMLPRYVAHLEITSLTFKLTSLNSNRTALNYNHMINLFSN